MRGSKLTTLHGSIFDDMVEGLAVQLPADTVVTGAEIEL